MEDQIYSPIPIPVLKETLNDAFEKFNVKPAPFDKTAATPPIPSDFSIRNEMSLVKSQGTQGSCTSFAVVACLEHIHKGDLSEAQVQHESERSYGDCKGGLAVVYAFQTCTKKGAIEENHWPYDDSTICWSNPPSTAGKMRYKFSDYGYIYKRTRSNIVPHMEKDSEFSIACGSGPPGLPLTVDIQRQIYRNRRPVCASVPVFPDAWPWNGDIEMPAPAALNEYCKGAGIPKDKGWHAIAICGWIGSSARFLFKNSWSDAWGDKGYGTIPYQYIDSYSDLAIIGW